jgi:7-carboxy-7-deazaguanine synthase
MADSRKSTLKVNEIFFSIQGESSHAGRPCVFIRLTYCNLRCTYCDTEYAFFEGKDMSIEQIMQKVAEFKCKLVEVTGGEPLIQKNVHLLMKKLCDSGYEVLLETAGHINISPVDKRVKKIMDLKCPSSGESEKIYWKNIDYLHAGDELKFVIGDRSDFEWAVNIIHARNLGYKNIILFSPVFGRMENKQLAGWILEEKLSVRMQLQIHKYIWEPDKRGV